jgi:ketopantoate reductase
MAVVRINGYELASDAVEAAGALITGIYNCKNENFGNAREMRTLFEATVQAQADRLASQGNISSEQLQVLEKMDIEAVRPIQFSDA